MRRFAGLRLTGALPDETTILNFRRLLEKHGLGEALFEEINAHLASLGRRLRTGTIVDVSIFAAPSSTKNRKKGAGSGDALDEEGRSVAFRDEGAHRRGFQFRAGALSEVGEEPFREHIYREFPPSRSSI